MKINTIITESPQLCPECGGPAFSDLMLAEKKDACYSKVRSRYKVWPSAYASGALVQCRKKGAANWGNKSKNESLTEFAPPGDDDRDYDPEEILHRLASQWWLGTEQDMIRAERTLASMGWEIGEDEGYDQGGVFVVRAGDEHGKSYISWPHEDLQTNETVAETPEATPFGSVVDNRPPPPMSQQEYRAQEQERRRQEREQEWEQDRPARIAQFREKKQDLLQQFAQLGTLRTEMIYGLENNVFLTKDQLIDFFKQQIDDPGLTALEYAHDNGIETGGLMKQILRRATQLGISMLDVRKMFNQAKQKVNENSASRKVDAKGVTQSEWMQRVKKRFPDAQIIQAKMIDGPAHALLSDGRKIVWNPVQDVAEGSAPSHSELARLAHEAYIAAVSKGNAPMADHYKQAYEKHKRLAASERKRAAKGVAEGSHEDEVAKAAAYNERMSGKNPPLDLGLREVGNWAKVGAYGDPIKSAWLNIAKYGVRNNRFNNSVDKVMTAIGNFPDLDDDVYDMYDINQNEVDILYDAYETVYDQWEELRGQQGVAEGSLEEYGDTAKGQKMLTKVQKRAVDRVTSKKADTDPAYAKKNKDTADRAWDRMTDKDVAEAGAGFRAGNARRAAINAMTPEERRAYDEKRAEQQRKRDEARMERERQRNASNKGMAEAHSAAQQAAIAINMKKAGKKPMNEYNAEYDDEAGMADNNLETLRRSIDGIDEIIKPGDNLPEWCQEKIANAKSMLVAVWDYMKSEQDRAADEEDEVQAMYEAMDRMAHNMAIRNSVSVDLVWDQLEKLPDGVLYETAQYQLNLLLEDWQKVNRRDKTSGMSRKAVKAYRRENPGSKLQTAVTTKPSKLKKGSKASKRRKSFCARMKGMKKSRASAKTKRDPNSNINKALRRWNC